MGSPVSVCSSRLLLPSPQLAEVHGVPRGLYDGPVHDVVLSTKAAAPTTASRMVACVGKVPSVPVRNLHQSGFSLSGRWEPGAAGRAGAVCGQGSGEAINICPTAGLFSLVPFT